jgi:hypothetical protein
MSLDGSRQECSAEMIDVFGVAVVDSAPANPDRLRVYYVRRLT